MLIATPTENGTALRSPDARLSRNSSRVQSLLVAAAFVATMALALFLAGIVTATIAGEVPAGPAGLVVLLAATLGTIGATIALTRRTFLGVLDAIEQRRTRVRRA
jgi:hypothetical protein